MTIKCSYNRNTEVIQTMNGAMHLMGIEHTDKPQYLDIHPDTKNT